MLKYPIFSKLYQVWEYIPLMLITFLFVAEAEIGNKVIGTTWNLVLALGIIVILYILLVLVKLPKFFVIIIAAVLWISFIFLKKIVLPTSSI